MALLSLPARCSEIAVAMSPGFSARRTCMLCHLGFISGVEEERGSWAPAGIVAAGPPSNMIGPGALSGAPDTQVGAIARLLTSGRVPADFPRHRRASASVRPLLHILPLHR